VEGVAADEQRLDAEGRDLAETPSDEIIALAPEGIGLELSERQHALLPRHLEAIDQVAVMVEGLSPAEVEVAAGQAEPLQPQAPRKCSSGAPALRGELFT
jgi:hypothetical protein